MAESTTVPKRCGIHMCGGAVSLKEKGSKQRKLARTLKSHHEAFFVVTPKGKLDWEWTTRGRKALKGKLVEPEGQCGMKDAPLRQVHFNLLMITLAYRLVDEHWGSGQNRRAAWPFLTLALSRGRRSAAGTEK